METLGTPTRQVLVCSFVGLVVLVYEVFVYESFEKKRMALMSTASAKMAGHGASDTNIRIGATIGFHQKGTLGQPQTVAKPSRKGNTKRGLIIILTRRCRSYKGTSDGIIRFGDGNRRVGSRRRDHHIGRFDDSEQCRRRGSGTLTTRFRTTGANIRALGTEMIPLT